MKNPDVDWFFNKDTKWQEEYATLRKIVKILDGKGLND